MDSSKIAVIIVAAGEGSRLPGDRPKAYRLLNGLPILTYNINKFIQHNDKYQIITAYNGNHRQWLDPILEQYPGSLAVEGGATRQESVYNALKAIENKGITHVLIHDAARPFVEADLLERVVQALENHPAVIPVVPVTDTIKRAQAGTVTETLNRAELVATQTPQGFDYQMIFELHHAYQHRPATDDATLAEWAGVAVKTVAGSPNNKKITVPEDMMMPQQPVNAMNLRTGMGFDVHQLVAEGATGSIKLCGVDVPCDARLEGHSDGDAGLHALTDAIFGALAVGDLGVHFSSDDDRWKGADSVVFLSYANKLMADNNAVLVHADITIIAQKPKVGPYREAMRQRIAGILGVELSRISVKATTTDGLGFTGRGEGIAAQAIVNLVINN